MKSHACSVSAVTVLVSLVCSGVLFSQQTGVILQLHYAGSWGGTGSEPGRLKQARSLAIDPAGDLFICDTGNHRIQKFSVQGRLIAYTGGFGWGQDQFDRPVSITARNGLDVYIADFNTNRILRYDKDCHFISSFSPGENDDIALRIEFPDAIDINQLGELFILDSVNRKAVKCDRTGVPVSVFGDIGGGDGRLRNPVDLHIDTSGKVYIADRTEQCLKVYDMYGNYLFDIGRDTNMDPGAVTTLGSDYIVCADHLAGTIRLFHQSGSFAGVLSTGFERLAIADIVSWKQFLIILDTFEDMVYVFSVTARGE